MKKFLCCLLAASSFLCAETVNMDKLSEALGHLLYNQLSSSEFGINLDRVIEGLKKAQKGEASPMTTEEYEKAFASLQQQMTSKKAETNLAQANDFLEKNARKEGIECLLPGLQFSVTEKGSGKVVSEGATPVLHYTGRFIDGTVFSTSVGSEPLSLPLTQTIEGFRKGIVGMKEGEKRTLYIHPDLAYGTQNNPSIPPNSLLIFEIEIIQAEKEEAKG